MLRVPDTPINVFEFGSRLIRWYRRCDLSEKYLNNNDAVFDLNGMVRDSSRALFISVLKCFGREESSFSCSSIFIFQDS